MFGINPNDSDEAFSTKRFTHENVDSEFISFAWFAVQSVYDL